MPCAVYSNFLEWFYYESFFRGYFNLDTQTLFKQRITKCVQIFQNFNKIHKRIIFLCRSNLVQSNFNSFYKSLTKEKLSYFLFKQFFKENR